MTCAIPRAFRSRRFDAKPHPLSGLRIGASVDFGYAAVSSSVRSAFASAVDVLADCGACISEDTPALDSQILEHTLKPIAFIEQAAAAGGKTAEDLADSEADYRKVTDYIEAGYRRGQACGAFQKLFDRVDALVTPTVAVTAFEAGKIGVASVDGRVVDPHLGWSPFS